MQSGNTTEILGIANAFIRGAVYTFQIELNTKLVRHNLCKKQSPRPSKPICIDIGVTGKIRGKVIYSMDESVAYNVAKAMLSDKNGNTNKLPAEIKKNMNSAVAEIANIITGQASIELTKLNEHIEITPPTIFTGSREIDFLKMETICLSLISEIGSLEINIAVSAGRTE